ncbi:MAG: PHP-associated domain-containing protein [Chloroflexota bacterium]
MTAEPIERLGRADLHVHTLASDGVDSAVAILDHVAAEGILDVIAIADHERIDAAVAARTMAADRGLPFEVIVGEEISTRGGHLVALFMEKAVPPLKPLRWSIEAIHDQGGLAIPAHPLVPFPMCAQGSVLRGLLGEDNPAVRPDALETFNPTALGKYRHAAVVRFAQEHGLAQVGNSDAHTAAAIGTGWTTFPGRTADDLRAAILAATTMHHGSFHGSIGQLGVYGRQLRKYSRGWQATVGGRLRHDGTGRDLGYPGGRQRPEAFDRDLARRQWEERGR